jgi:hypothetical protein
MYYYHDDDWGEQHEHEDENQWEEMDESYPAEESYEAYPTEAEDPEYERQDSEEIRITCQMRMIRMIMNDIRGMSGYLS